MPTLVRVHVPPFFHRAAVACAIPLALLAAPALARAAVCNGAVEARALGIDAPAPPESYTLPDDVIVVSSTQELQDLLVWNLQTNQIQLDIVLLDGVYEPDDLTNGKYLKLYGSHRLWARHPGGAVLKFGIDAGGNNPAFYGAGAEFHGLTFDITDPTAAPVFADTCTPDHDCTQTVDSYALITWGASENVRVEDCYFLGNGVIGWGVVAKSPNGFVGSRLVIDGFLMNGLRVSVPRGTPDLPVPVQLSDLVVTNIDAPNHEPPSAESAIQLFATGSLERAYIRDVHRAGVVTGGNIRGGLVRDIDVDRLGGGGVLGVGIYMDNTTESTEITEFCVGPRTDDGVRSEWDNYKAPLNPAKMFSRGINNYVNHGLIESTRMGVAFDQGTIDSGVEDCILRNYTYAGIWFNRNYADPLDWPNYTPQVMGSWEAGNTFLEDPADACEVVRDQHPNNVQNPVCA